MRDDSDSAMKVGLHERHNIPLTWFVSSFDGLEVRIPRALDPVVELRKIADSIEAKREAEDATPDE